MNFIGTSFWGGLGGGVAQPLFSPTVAWDFRSGSLNPIIGSATMVFGRADGAYGVKNKRQHLFGHNQPRFHENGLYFNGAARNVLLQSENASLVPWTGGAIVQPGTDASPETVPAQTGDTIYDNAVTPGGAPLFRQQNIEVFIDAGINTAIPQTGVAYAHIKKKIGIGQSFPALEVRFTGSAGFQYVITAVLNAVSGAVSAQSPQIQNTRTVTLPADVYDLDTHWLLCLPFNQETATPITYRIYPAYNLTGLIQADGAVQGQSGFWGYGVHCIGANSDVDTAFDGTFNRYVKTTTTVQRSEPEKFYADGATIVQTKGCLFTEARWPIRRWYGVHSATAEIVAPPGTPFWSSAAVSHPRFQNFGPTEFKRTAAWRLLSNVTGRTSTTGGTHSINVPVSGVDDRTLTATAFYETGTPFFSLNGSAATAIPRTFGSGQPNITGATRILMGAGGPTLGTGSSAVNINGVLSRVYYYANPPPPTQLPTLTALS